MRAQGFLQRQHRIQRSPIFFAEAMQPVQSLLDLHQSCRVGLHLITIPADLIGQIPERKGRIVHNSCPLDRGGIDRFYLGDELTRDSQLAQHPLVAGIEQLMQLVGQVPELLAVHQPRTLLGQAGIFVRFHFSVRDLLILKSEQILPFTTLCDVRGDGLQFGHPVLPERIRNLILVTKGVKPAEGVQRLQLRSRRQQRLLFVLPVHIDQRAAQFFQKMNRAEVAVQIGPIASRARDDPPNENIPVAGARKAFALKEMENGMIGGQMKGCFEIGFIGLGTDLIDGGAASDQERDRIDEERFAGPGFTGEHDETGAERDSQLLDDAEIRDAQLGQHAAESQALGGAGMLGEKRIDDFLELALRTRTD